MGQMVDFTMERGRTGQVWRPGRTEGRSGGHYVRSHVLLYHKACSCHVQ